MGQFMGTCLVLGVLAVGNEALVVSSFSERDLVESSVHCIMSEHGIQTCVYSVSAQFRSTEEEEAEYSSSFL